MLVFRIAFRYLLALRRSSTVQVLSLLSFFGIMLGTLAMLVVLSGFNGFEGLLRGVYHIQDPDFRVVPARGKSFRVDSQMIHRITAVEGVAGAFEVLRDKASIQYGEGQMVVDVLGVDPAMIPFSRLDTSIGSGEFVLQEDGGANRVVLSVGIQKALQINLNNRLEWVRIVYPKRKKIARLGTGKIFNQAALQPSGVLLQDELRAYVPLEEARSLMEKPGEASYLEVFAKTGFSPERIQTNLQNALGSDFLVLNEDQQHADLFRVMKIEKLFVFLALGFIILISTFNLFVSCTMLVLDKTKDLKILAALGIPSTRLSAIIRTTGFTLTGAGLLSGLAGGLVLCWIQMEFGLVPLGMASTFVEAYPIVVNPWDMVAISIWVIFASVLALWLPGKRAASIGAQVSFRSE